MPLPGLLWPPSGTISATHMEKTVVAVAGRPTHGVVHYTFVCRCDFLPLALRSLAVPCKVSGFSTVITVASLCSSIVRLSRSIAMSPMLR